MSVNPKLVIIDSIQTMYSEEITSAAGTVSQVREITSRIMRMCKDNGITHNNNWTRYKRWQYSRTKGVGTYGRYCIIFRG